MTYVCKKSFLSEKGKQYNYINVISEEEFNTWLTKSEKRKFKPIRDNEQWDAENDEVFVEPQDK